MADDPYIVTPAHRLLDAFAALHAKVGERIAMELVLFGSGKVVLLHRDYQAEVGSGKPDPQNADEAAAYLRDAYVRLRAAMSEERGAISKALGSEK